MHQCLSSQKNNLWWSFFCLRHLPFFQIILWCNLNGAAQQTKDFLSQIWFWDGAVDVRNAFLSLKYFCNWAAWKTNAALPEIFKFGMCCIQQKSNTLLKIAKISEMHCLMQCMGHISRDPCFASQVDASPDTSNVFHLIALPRVRLMGVSQLVILTQRITKTHSVCFGGEELLQHRWFYFHTGQSGKGYLPNNRSNWLFFPGGNFSVFLPAEDLIHSQQYRSLNYDRVTCRVNKVVRL